MERASDYFRQRKIFVVGCTTVHIQIILVPPDAWIWGKLAYIQAVITTVKESLLTHENHYQCRE